MSDSEKIACMAMDAFRLCIGLPTRTFSPAEIAAFVGRRATSGSQVPAQDAGDN